tara:strand:+ start:87 stop:731 length:645 start_codon:yes stop_codon:yes gene_type:complete
MFDKNQIIKDRLEKIVNPRILELGVNRGRSTKRFFDHIEKNGGELYSIDIKDCSKALENINWNFFQSNDLDIEKILLKFPKLKNGIDILFIDSYHDPSHVKMLLNIWFFYVKKNGYIFLDDTESYLYRLKKKSILSIINDAINLEIKKFYHQNYNQLIYIKYYHGSGLAEFQKTSNLNSLPNKIKLWDYNFIFSKIYLILKKLKFDLVKFSVKK